MNKLKFIKGADISMLDELEQLGVQYYNNGHPDDLFKILKAYGVNLIRLRIWNDPQDAAGNFYGGGNNNFEVTKRLAKRVKENGMQFMLNFHYSDFWADPEKQLKPKAWQELGQEELEKEVYRYTQEIVTDLVKEDLRPEMIQIGNEVTNGLLWPNGKTPDYKNMTALLMSGIRAVRQIDPSIKIILHLDLGGDNVLYRNWFDQITSLGADFDIIGLSYYPLWHGTMEELIDNMNDISQRYGKDTLVVETAYGFTTDTCGEKHMAFTEESAKKCKYAASPEGQSEFLTDLMRGIQDVNNKRGMGMVYWEPGWLPKPKTTWAAKAGRAYISDKESEGGNHWANQALFDFEGNALPALQVLKDYK